MPKFILPLNNMSQPIAIAFIILDDNMPPQKTVQARALFDTGANKSCITTNVANKLNLIPICKVPLTTASDTIDTNKYIIKLSLPFPSSDPYILKMSEILQLEVMETKDNPNFDIIIGMDIISRGILILSDNSFIFSL
ncbi:retropepsin-like aspartic protease [Brachyspira pilosicoli]|uniref:retropepsin-like aspartic protease n=1 Tax=Brachyspira pilosicoli TaxID=52584 RepID=UPI0030076E06